MTRSLIALVASLGVAAISDCAQGQIRGYSPPAGAVLPGQLEYFRPQSGVLDQYNQFIAPRENLNNQLRTMSAQQSADYQAAFVQKQLRESGIVRDSQAAPTGTRAGFMNYSHYYGGRGGMSVGTSRQATPPQRYSSSLPGVGTGMGLQNGIGSGIGGGGIY
jgi:hypothetical protein